MKLLDLYISKRFLGNLLFSLLAFIVIFIVVDLVENFDKFLDRAVPPNIIILNYVYFLPFIIVMVLPICVLLASLFCTGNMSKHNELVAMKATGISLYRILLPMLILGFIISLATLFIDELITPDFNRRKSDIKYNYLEKHDHKIRRRLSNLTVRDRKDRRTLIRYYDADKRIVQRVTIQVYQGTSVVKRYDAPQLAWRMNRWEMLNGSERVFNGEQEILTTFTSLPMPDLGFKEEDIARVQLEPEEMSLWNLRDFIAEVRRNGGNVNRWLVDYHLKIAFPFASLIIVLIGAPLASSKRRSGMAIGFGISLFVCFLYFGLIRTGQSLGYTGVINPVFSAWLGNIVFFIVGIVLLRRTDT